MTRPHRPPKVSLYKLEFRSLRPTEKPVPVLLSVRCDRCKSRREVAWAYLAAGSVWYGAATEDYVPRQGAARHRASQGDAIAAAKAGGRRWEPPTNRTSRCLDKPRELEASCPKHGPLHVGAVDPGALDRQRTTVLACRPLSG